MSSSLIAGHALAQHIKDNGGYTLPVGLLSRLLGQSHEQPYLASQLDGLILLFEALSRTLARKGSGEYSDSMFTSLAELGLVLDSQTHQSFEKDMMEMAKKIGPNFLAFYELMAFETENTLSVDDDDESDDDTKSLEQAYRRLTKETLKTWSVVDLMSVIKNTVSHLRTLRAEQTGQPFSIMRTQQLVDILKLPLKFQPLMEGMLAVSTVSLLHPLRAYDLSYQLSGVFMPVSGSDSDQRLSRMYETRVFLDLFPKIETNVIEELTSSPKGWMMARGFFPHHETWTQRLLAYAQANTTWMTIVSTPLSEDLQEALVNRGLDVRNPLSPLSPVMNKVEDFAFLGRDLQLLQSVFNADRPMRVLVAGSKGSGRRAMISTVSQASQKEVYCVKGLNHYNGPLASFYSLAQAQTSGILLEGNVLVVEKFPTVDDRDISTACLHMSTMPRHLHEMWLCNDMEEVPQRMLEFFDLVIQMPIMPIRQREGLAKKLLGEDLAEKAAQSTTLPGEILDMAEWATRMGVHDWNALSASLLGVQRARLSKSNNQNGDLPLQLYPPNSIDHGFEAVIGEEDNIRKAKELSEALKSPLAYEKMGVKPPKGLLLLGPPGTGKTHLARAVAKDAGVNLLLASASGMAQKPECIQAVFNEARKQSPCILFIDEIDAVGTTAGQNADPNRQTILNRLLTELDGFEALDGVLVIGATHRGELLDAAITRSGRLGHSISFKHPERAERVLLWKHYTKHMALASIIDWERVAKVSTGMTPADIQMAANNAGLHALRHHQDTITTKNLLACVEDLLWGEYRDNLPMEKDELYRTCVHEAGHAMVSFFHHLDMDRVCVRPRGEALGFVRLSPQEGRYGLLQGDMMARISMALSGGLAEQTVFSSHGTGVSSDLSQARMLAVKAVRVCGMHPSLPTGVECNPFAPPPSEALIKQAEKAEEEIIESCRKIATKFLEENKIVLVEFADWLHKEREIEGCEVENFLKKKLSHVSPPFPRNATLLQAASSHTS